jgi:hypothetical protein
MGTCQDDTRARAHTHTHRSAASPPAPTAATTEPARSCPAAAPRRPPRRRRRWRRGCGGRRGRPPPRRRPGPAGPRTPASAGRDGIEGGRAGCSTCERRRGFIEFRSEFRTTGMARGLRLLRGAGCSACALIRTGVSREPGFCGVGAGRADSGQALVKRWPNAGRTHARQGRRPLQRRRG